MSYLEDHSYEYNLYQYRYFSFFHFSEMHPNISAKFPQISAYPVVAIERLPLVRKDIFVLIKKKEVFCISAY